MTDNTLAVGQNPEDPTRPSVSLDTLDEYFQSIKEPFQETRDGMARDVEGINNWIVGFFIFSLIPLFPFAASKLFWEYFPRTSVSIWRIHFHLASFWFWWVAFFIVSLITLLLAAKVSGASGDEKKKWLSRPQMRFAFCYAVVDEIRKYKTNQREDHIATALEYLDQIRRSLSFRPTAHYYGGPELLRYAQLLEDPQIGIIHHSWSGAPKWYRLQPETEMILKAFDEFMAKLRDRLKDRKDLQTIATALTYLASYQYFEIPELSDSKSEEYFEEGIQSLVNFAKQVTSLPPYSSERAKVTPKEKLSRKLIAFMGKVTALFGHENPLLAFFVWLIFLALLFSIGFFEMLRYFAIKVDSTILTTLVGGPILGALTAVTIPRLGRQKKQT